MLSLILSHLPLISAAFAGSIVAYIGESVVKAYMAPEPAPRYSNLAEKPIRLYKEVRR